MNQLQSQSLEQIKKNNIAQVFEIYSCPVCGKNFIPAPEHVYRIRKNKNYVLVCSWRCVRSHEKEMMKGTED